MSVRVGDRGRAITPLKPGGKVAIDESTFDARSEFGFIEVGGECIVVRAGLGGLVVRAVEPGRAVSPLPNHGEPVSLASDRRAEIEEQHAAERRAAEAGRAEWHRIGAGVIAAGSLGVLVGLGSAGLGPILGWVPLDHPGDLALLLGGGLAAGATWSLVLFYLLGRLGQKLTRRPGGHERFAPSFVTLFTALVGTAAGAWHGSWSGGWRTIVGLGLIGAGIGTAVGWVGKWLLTRVTNRVVSER